MKQKVSKVEYSKAMLPRTRKAQFGDCFKMNYLVLLKSGLLLFAFALPLIGFCLFMDFYYVAIMQKATEAIEQTQLLFFYFYNIGVVLLFLPIVIGVTGVIHVLRNFIWGEGIFFMHDFAQGIKENAGKNILFSVIWGLIYLLSFFIYSIFRVPVVSLFPLALFAFVFFPIYLWMLLLNNIYESKFGQLLKNGTFFYVKTLGWSLLGVLIPLALVALIFIPFYFVWLKYIFLALLFVFVIPIVLLVLILYSMSKFDEHINKENYPDYYLKGLNH